jgi:hypothetical protein
MPLPPLPPDKTWLEIEVYQLGGPYSNLVQFKEEWWGESPQEVIRKWYDCEARPMGDAGETIEGMRYEPWQPVSWDEETDSSEFIVQMPNGKWRMGRSSEL